MTTAPSVVVLVTFHSRSGSTEKLASSLAVGAVQARSAIRMRRVPDADPAEALRRFPDCRETLVRMHKEYVPPTEADVLGTDAIVLAPRPGSGLSEPEWAEYVTILRRLGGEGKLAGKIGAVVDAGNAATTASFSGEILRLGLLAVPPDPWDAGRATPESATAHGRRLARVVRALKQAGAVDGRR